MPSPKCQIHHAGICGSLLLEIANIIAGLVLAAGIVTSIPAIGKDIARVARWLGRFQTIIGIIAIVVGIWGLI